MSGRAAFDELCDDLLARDGDLQRAQMMGYPSLKRNGRLVACFSAGEDAMVLRLTDPAARGEMLALDGAHLFDPGGRGGEFRHWVVVPPALAERWPELVAKALA